MAKRSRFKDFLWRHSAGIAFLVMVAFVALIGFVGYTYVVITKKFDSSRRWDLPSRIYSDATASRSIYRISSIPISSSARCRC